MTKLLAMLACLALAACAADDAYRTQADERTESHEVKLVSKADSAGAGGSLSAKGEPVYSTSFAIRLAELALRDTGVKFEERNVVVSFCDGVYTVTYERPEDTVNTKDFCVQIDANTSRILAVKTE